MRILSLDVGEKRIGVARADSQTRIAVPVGTINCDGSEWEAIEKYTKLYDTKFFVLGLPRNNNGSETKQTLYVRNFAKTLVQKIPEAKIRFQDESLTSVLAEERLKKRKKNYEKGEIDAEAAAIILQDFLESYRERLADIPQTNIIEKKAKKAALDTKKMKHKTKKLVKKILIIPPIVLIIIALAIGGIIWYKNYRAAERAAEYARQEAEMQANSVFSFTILPGETIFDIQEKLLNFGYSETEITTAFDQKYDYPMFKTRPANASLEGYLFGETFEFYKSDSVEKIIDTYLANFQKVIDENNFASKYADHGLTLYEGIILASVVQKEAAPIEQPTVAQVFYSRLEYGWKLGSDVTVSYAKKVVDPNNQICAKDDNACVLSLDSCYNTRRYTGLPCGAISNPSLSALNAVAEPSDTAYLYFLTGDDGSMYYSYTEEQHLQAIRDHCQVLCNASL